MSSTAKRENKRKRFIKNAIKTSISCFGSHRASVPKITFYYDKRKRLDSALDAKLRLYPLISNLCAI